MKTHTAKALAGKPTLRQPTQSRSRESTEALLEIGRRLIEQRGVDDCSMNEVAAAARSSVGSLYFRFGNKERFVSEVMRRQVDATRDQISRFLAELGAKATSPTEVIEAAAGWLVLEYGKNQGLLRAQIRRALDNPQEWQPFQKIGRELVDGAIKIIERYPEVQQDSDWQRRVRIAMQMILGLLNNAVINRPGPLELSDSATSKELYRAAIRYLGWNEPKKVRPDRTLPSGPRSKQRELRIGGKAATFRQARNDEKMP
jgi:AcrR family transcriptional regulator